MILCSCLLLPLRCPILLKVFRLLEYFLVYLISIDMWIAVFDEDMDQLYLQFGFDVVAVIPGGVFGLVVDDHVLFSVVLMRAALLL